MFRGWRGKANEENPFPENCSSCLFWERNEQECHRRINRVITPPKKVDVFDILEKDLLWANTDSNDWCGDYRKRPAQGNSGY